MILSYYVTHHIFYLEIFLVHIIILYLCLFLQTETRDGTVGESDEKKETDQEDARELQKEKTWRKLQRPQTLFYLLGDLCPGRYFVHITTFVWLRTHWSGPLQEVKHGEWSLIR